MKITGHHKDKVLNMSIDTPGIALLTKIRMVFQGNYKPVTFMYFCIQIPEAIYYCSAYSHYFKKHKAC